MVIDASHCIYEIIAIENIRTKQISRTNFSFCQFSSVEQKQPSGDFFDSFNSDDKHVYLCHKNVAVIIITIRIIRIRIRIRIRIIIDFIFRG